MNSQQNETEQLRHFSPEQRQNDTIHEENEEKEEENKLNEDNDANQFLEKIQKTNSVEKQQKEEEIKDSQFHIDLDVEKELNSHENTQVKNSNEEKQKKIQEEKLKKVEEMPKRVEEQKPKKVEIRESLNTIVEDELLISSIGKKSGKISKMKEKVRESQLKPKKKKKKMFGAKTQEQVEEEVKKWKLQQKEIKKKRELQVLMRQRKRDELAYKMAQEDRIRQERQQSLRKEQIQRRIEAIQRRKKSRQQEIRSAVHRKSEEKLPVLYREREKQYANQVQKEEEKIRQIIRKRREEMVLKAEEIRAHEKAFINQLKERFTKQEKGKNQTTSTTKKHKSEFNLYVGHNEEERKMEFERYKRRKKFQDRIRKIPINIDQQKRKEALIQKDKAQNPLKYNYLLGMGLSEEKIFDEFKEFEININKYELGNNYMKKAHENITEERMKASKSTPAIKSTKPEYKNYLPEVKIIRRKKEKTVIETQVDEVLHHFKHNSERQVEFGKKSQEYEDEAISKIKKLKLVKGYNDSLKQEEQIDDLYMKSIQLKLASAQLS